MKISQITEGVIDSSILRESPENVDKINRGVFDKNLKNVYNNGDPEMKAAAIARMRKLGIPTPDEEAGAKQAKRDQRAQQRAAALKPQQDFINDVVDKILYDSGDWIGQDRDGVPSVGDVLPYHSERFWDNYQRLENKINAQIKKMTGAKNGDAYLSQAHADYWADNKADGPGHPSYSLSQRS